MHRRDFLGLGGGSLVLSSLIAAARVRAQRAATGPVVETSAGRIRGLSANGVVTFKGIRYGASTAGANRFQPPVKPQPWTGIVDAFEYGPRAWQPTRPMIPEIGDALTGAGPMDEDCLRINVWTPAPDRGRRAGNHCPRGNTLVPVSRYQSPRHRNTLRFFPIGRSPDRRSRHPENTTVR